MVAWFHEMLFPMYRLDWFGAGPSSPNKTGSFLALLFLLALWPCFRFRRGFWVSLPLAVVAGVFLLQTESRGGILALLVGVGVMLCFSRPKTWPRRRIAAGALVLVLLLVYSQGLGVTNRFEEMTSGNDGSSNVRVALYSAGLRMIAAQPLGWGHGAAARVYGQWYQEPGDDRSYLSLVNSHLTWMADYGVVFQFFYLCGWVLVLLLCWPGPKSPLRITTFCCWLALGVAGFFSSVLTLLWLWAIPVGLLLLCLVQRAREGVWFEKRQWRAAVLALFVLFVGLQGMARLVPGTPRISCRKGCVQVGGGGGILLVNPVERVLGARYGHELRAEMGNVAGVTVLTHIEQLGELSLDAFSCVALCGDVEQLEGLKGYAGLVTLLNPESGALLAAMDPDAEYRLQVVLGGLGDWRRARRWEKKTATHPGWETVVVPGAADYIPGWLHYCVEEG